MTCYGIPLLYLRRNDSLNMFTRPQSLVFLMIVASLTTRYSNKRFKPRVSDFIYNTRKVLFTDKFMRRYQAACNTKMKQEPACQQKTAALGSILSNLTKYGTLKTAAPLRTSTKFLHSLTFFLHPLPASPLFVIHALPIGLFCPVMSLQKLYSVSENEPLNNLFCCYCLVLLQCEPVHIFKVSACMNKQLISQSRQVFCCPHSIQRINTSVKITSNGNTSPAEEAMLVQDLSNMLQLQPHNKSGI